MKAFDLISIGVALLALLVAYFAYRSNRRQELSKARTELIGYAAKMAALDRKAGRANGHQVGMLARQSEQVIDAYSQKRLKLAPAVLRIMADFSVLDTDDLSLANKLLDMAQTLAQVSKDDLECIRICRVRGEIAARDADVEGVKKHFSKAVSIAVNYNKPESRRAIKVESLERTYALAFFAAFLSADRGGGEQACEAARRYHAKAIEHGLESLRRRGSLQVARRAQLIHDSDACLIDGFSLDSWKEIWKRRNSEGVSY